MSLTEEDRVELLSILNDVRESALEGGNHDKASSALRFIEMLSGEEDTGIVAGIISLEDLARLEVHVNFGKFNHYTAAGLSHVSLSFSSMGYPIQTASGQAHNIHNIMHRTEIDVRFREISSKGNTVNLVPVEIMIDR